MRRLWLASAVLVALIAPADAQFKVVPACPSATQIQGTGGGYGSVAVDPYGNVCGGSSGGGGGTATPPPVFFVASTCPAGVPSAQCIVANAGVSWTPPSGFAYLEIWAWGPGAGGGGGAQQAASTACSGGGGGGAGGKDHGVYTAAQVGAGALTINVPAGFAGGLGATATSTAGGLPTASTGYTYAFVASGSQPYLIYVGYGGGGGSGNLATQSFGGGGGSPNYFGGNATASAAGTNILWANNGGAGVASVLAIGFGLGTGGGGDASGSAGTASGYALAGPSGGGSGGGVSAANAGGTGGAGGLADGYALTSTAGTAACANAANGMSPSWLNTASFPTYRGISRFSGSGGAGGGGCPTGPGGAGGNGGAPGGGGGGGACATNGNPGGNGGKGGDGLMIVQVHY